MPQQLSQGTTLNHKAVAKYEVGSYDFSLQIDIWCGSKEERFRIYDDFFKAINRDVEVMGLSLQLKTYHNIYARYDLTGFNFDDGEQTSQLAEWRAILSVSANCKAILDKTQPIITQPIETQTTIEDNAIEP
jgi:hypothetical protein